jgi:receptor expression-enhancing protein 5/6
LLTGPSGGQLLVNFAGFIIPGYYSLEALFSVSKTDDTQWLTVCFCIPS